jgi:hypothetical protein
MTARKPRKAKAKQKPVPPLTETDLLVIMASIPGCEMSRVTIQYIAAYASRRLFTAMLDREIAHVPASDEQPSFSMFSSADRDSLIALRDHIASDPAFVPDLTILVDVIACFLDSLAQPNGDHRDNFAAALTAVATQASPDLCAGIVSPGLISRKVKAIKLLQAVHPHVAATVQDEIATAFDAAIQQEPDNKKLVAAITAAQEAIKSAAVVTIPPKTAEEDAAAA